MPGVAILTVPPLGGRQNSDSTFSRQGMILTALQRGEIEGPAREDQAAEQDRQCARRLDSKRP